MFIILNWSDYEDVAIVTEEDGTPKLFKFLRDAEKFARENLNFNWQVAYLR